MNARLRREIIRQITDRFGLMTKVVPGTDLGIIRDELVLEKRLVIDDEEHLVWGGSCEIGNTIVQTLVADTKDRTDAENRFDEFAILIRVDKLPAYAVWQSSDFQDTGIMAVRVEYNGKSKWIDANTVVQAKCLIGVESLAGQLLNWKKLNPYKEMFELLVEFIRQDGE